MLSRSQREPRRPRPRIIPGFLAVCLTAVLMAVGSPAQAQTVYLTDPANDHVPPGGKDWHGAGDLIGVFVNYTPRALWVDGNYRTGPYSSFTVRIDTRPDVPGPEIVAADDGYGLGLWRTGSKRVKCPGARLTLVNDGKTHRLRIPRRCLAGPAGVIPPRVRVQVSASDDSGYYTYDYVPSAKTFTRWLAAG